MYRSSYPKGINTVTYMGVGGCIRRAKESVFWPGLNAEINDMVGKCEPFSDDRARNHYVHIKSLIAPWAKVGVDLFTWSDRNYLRLVDYYSYFIEVEPLTEITSKASIHKLKQQFSRQGIPSTVQK